MRTPTLRRTLIPLTALSFLIIALLIAIRISTNSNNEYVPDRFVASVRDIDELLRTMERVKADRDVGPFDPEVGGRGWAGAGAAASQGGNAV
ncbi:hypothetical protein HK102_007556 [Quaeritorhiza haematococci]|nr:hypothetical protein HK102_007556 [Quaeritorhiza haematococci]